MLAVLVVLAAVATVAMLGWNTAIRRADAQTDRASALQAAAADNAGSQRSVASLQASLADAKAQGQALQAQLAGSQAALATAQDALAAAEAHAAVADKAAEATRARADGQPTPGAPPPVNLAARQPAATPSPAPEQSGIAPERPLPGLPPNATPRDYLVAAQQAVREGRIGRAQSALGHAEIRLLNEGSLNPAIVHPASHPGVSEIERALDQLGNGDTHATLQTIDALLARR